MPVQKSEVPVPTSASKPERQTRKLIKLIIKCKIKKVRWREREEKNQRSKTGRERGRDECRHGWERLRDKSQQ